MNLISVHPEGQCKAVRRAPPRGQHLVPDLAAVEDYDGAPPWRDLDGRRSRCRRLKAEGAAVSCGVPVLVVCVQDERERARIVVAVAVEMAIVLGLAGRVAGHEHDAGDAQRVVVVPMPQ